MKRVSPIRTTAGIDRRVLLGAAAAALAWPSPLRAQEGIRVAALHPVAGPLAGAGSLARAGVRLGRELSGGDASGVDLREVDLDPDPGRAADTVSRLAEEGVSALIGCLTSPLTYAVALAARRHGLPLMVDSAGSDAFLGPDMPRVFRFSPGFDRIARDGVATLAAFNEASGAPARSVQIVAEARGFGANVAARVADRLDAAGFELFDTLSVRTPGNADETAETVRHSGADIVVPLASAQIMEPLLAAILREGVPAKALFTVMGPLAGETEALAKPAFDLLLDANHGFSVAGPEGVRLRSAIASGGLPVRPEVYLAVNAMRCLCNAVRRAGSADPGEIARAIAAGGWREPAMPYGPTAFADGQNIGAQGVVLQVQAARAALVAPSPQADAEAVYPRPV